MDWIVYIFAAIGVLTICLVITVAWVGFFVWVSDRQNENLPTQDEWKID